jgi:hypothetical protein
MLRGKSAWVRTAGMVSVAAVLLAVGPMSGSSPAVGEATPTALPKPPADGIMGFVVDNFVAPIVPGKESCPDGPALKLRDAYVAGLAPAERERLLRKENEKELERAWKLSAFGPNDTNVCSQPDMFDHPLLHTVKSPLGWGLDLDGDGGKGAAGADGCAQQDFTSPTGDKGVDNQEYRAMGCKREWRGADGMPSDQAVGMKQFYVSGEWTQVILLRGVDSLEHDDDVEVIYGNTPDRPFVDSKGNFLRGATFTISEAPPRHRNVLHGKIENGILTTRPQDIALTQTWGQGGARDIRGNRGVWDFREGRLRLAFQPDGTLRGMLGGYRPLFDLIISPSLGSAGSPLVAGIDCAAELKTIRKYADGLRNPKTGQCEGISSAMEVSAVPAFVNDVPARQRTAAR